MAKKNQDQEQDVQDQDAGDGEDNFFKPTDEQRQGGDQIDLDEEDERILDRVWDRIAAEEGIGQEEVDDAADADDEDKEDKK